MNLKVNVASSENANNAIMADEYNTYQPYLRQARKDNVKVRDTMEFHPCVLFVKDESGNLFGDTDLHLYAAGDLGNSKKNSEAMGMDTTNDNECIIEVLNNTADQCRFKSDDLTDEAWDGDGNFEFRYEPTNVDAAKTAWQKVLSWVVSTDPEQATGATFPSAVTYDGTSYTKDTAEYRKAKFKAEVSDYFIVDTLLYHYLFTERHSMVDNRAKNTFVHSEDLVHWDYCFDYDNDTADGNDNEGGLTLTYGLEDTDQIGTKNVFNAADSVLWCNVRDCLADELKTMYIDRENAGAWDKDRIIQKFKSYQSLKPERLIIADMHRKYFRPYEDNGVTSYLPMMYGTKESQREQYETYQAAYISSKYQGVACTSDVITLRTYTPTNYTGVTPENKLVLEPYADIYLGLRAGSRTYNVRAKRGTRYEMTFDEIGSLNDTEVYIYSASRISAIDNLAALYVGYCNFAAGDKLQEIIVGSSVSGYSNTNFTSFNVGNNVLLKKLDLQGCPNLKSSIDLSGCISLREFYAKGSGITGVIFAPGGLLEKAELPSPANLSMRRLKVLTSFTLESYASLKTLRLEDCPLFDTLAFINKATALTRLRLTNIDWKLDSLDVLDRMAAMGGLDENEYNTEVAVVTGTAHVTDIKSYQLTTYLKAFPNLVITYDTLTEVFTVTVVTPKWTDVQYIERGKDAEDPTTRSDNPKPTPVKDSTVSTVYTFSGWDKLFTGVTANRTINAVFSESVRQYTVRWFSDGSLMETKKWDAYSTPTYSGDEPEKDDLPASYIYYVWSGWDNVPASLTEDTDINATFVECILPASAVDGSLYDYICSDDPEDNSAYTFGQLYAIINSGKAKEYLAVKDKIKIVLDTTVIKDTCIVLNVHSFGHYELADGTGNMSNVDFYMVGVLNANRQMNGSNTNVGGWDATALRTWMNGPLYLGFPLLWRKLIKKSITLANAGNQSSDIIESEDLLRIPATAEFGFETTAVPYKNEVSANASEIKFSQYTDNNSRIKKTFNGEGTVQTVWTRSAESGGAVAFRSVFSYGTSASYGASASNGVCVGFSA